MYRKKNNRTYFPLGIRVLFTLFIFFGFFFFSFSSAATTSMKAGDAIKQVFALFKKSPDLAKLQKKTTIKNLYSQSLQVIQKTEFNTLFDALDKTAKAITAQDTSDSTNDAYVCSLTSEDIMYVMYQEDRAFKKTINQIAAKSIPGTFQEPQKDQYIAACKKFNSCWFDDHNYLDTIKSRTFCKDFILQNYQVAHAELINIASLSDVNYGDEFFWNTTLEDSDYDIMGDIRDLAKILFVSVVDPIETMFYAFPEVVNQTPVEDSIVGTDGRVDRFIPYPDSIMNCTGGICTGSNVVPPGAGTGTFAGSVLGTGVGDTLLDDQTLSFLEQTNALVPNDTSTLKGNQCLGSGIVLEEEEETATGGSGNVYVQSVLDAIDSTQCNQNNQCDTVESCSCVDCKDDARCVNEQCPASDGVCSQNEACTCDDCKENPSPSCTAGYYTGLATMIGSMQDSGDPTLQEEIKGCLQKCDEIKTNVTAMGSDIAICYARCACDTYESPVFDPSKAPGLTSNFKIEFCMIPPQESSFTRNKRVSNFEEIIENMKNVLQDLKEGGKMWVQTKTKEFIDSSVIKNNFAKQFSFTVNYQKKSLYADKSDLTQGEEQTAMNKTLQSTVLGFGSDIALDQEKNKYIVAADPCTDKKETETFINEQEKQKAIVACRAEETAKKPTLSQSPIVTFQDQKIALLDEEMNAFLQRNVEFWINVRGMLREMNEVAQVLSQK